MKRNKEQTLSEALNSMKDEYSLGQRLLEVRLINEWYDLVGPGINKYTKEVFVKNSKLYIKVSSSIVRNELSMIKKGLLESLNAKSGQIKIYDLVFI